MKNIIQVICKMRKRLSRLPCGYESNVCTHIIDLTEAMTQNEDGELVSYPETIVVKIENWSNHYYSVRTSDGRWISEGSRLNSKGLTIGQVYRRMLSEIRDRKLSQSKKKGA